MHSGVAEVPYSLQTSAQFIREASTHEGRTRHTNDSATVACTKPLQTHTHARINTHIHFVGKHTDVEVFTNTTRKGGHLTPSIRVLFTISSQQVLVCRVNLVDCVRRTPPKLEKVAKPVFKGLPTPSDL